VSDSATVVACNRTEIVLLPKLPVAKHSRDCVWLDDAEVSFQCKTAHALKIGEQHVITGTGKAFYDMAHAPADHSNRRRTPQDYAVWEVHPIMKMELVE
jgi:hypothetical protein